MRPRLLNVNGPTRALPLTPLLETFSQEFFPVLIRFRYWNPMILRPSRHSAPGPRRPDQRLIQRGQCATDALVVLDGSQACAVRCATL